MRPLTRKLQLLAREMPDRRIDRLDVMDQVDLYVLVSEVISECEDMREEIRDSLLEQINTGSEVTGEEYGSVRTYTRTYRSFKDEDHVVSLFESEGVTRESVTSLDADRVDELLDTVGIDESDVYDETDRTLLRKGEFFESSLSG